ncbi:uncharacterized protein [Triticum aestivum]|uniref:uncharacterized protein n=1 Tax=Triticum aestivum TaxID=4565 RepID=UPI001D027D55|nr:uncharacterized protein LOC123114941 [Triticum aestivum]
MDAPYQGIVYRNCKKIMRNFFQVEWLTKSFRFMVHQVLLAPLTVAYKHLHSWRACSGALPLLNSSTPREECSRTIQILVMSERSWRNLQCNFCGVAELANSSSSKTAKQELPRITSKCHRQASHA